MSVRSTPVAVVPASIPSSTGASGFRVYGQRAVRIDILERLADLIRPALYWRRPPRARGPRAFPGGGFTVTPP
jgi:ATP-dependent RNA helicase SUPV3L1/SUV3